MGIVLSSTVDMSPLWISLKTALVATILCFVVGVLAAWKLYNTKWRGMGIVDALLTLPMVLPPTVTGYFLLLIFSRRRPVGQFLFEQFNISIVQSWAGCVIASFRVALPLVYLNAKSAFRQVDKELLDMGRTLGMSEFKILIHILIPVAFDGLLSGVILAFARALGEYGATSMLAGNIPGKTSTVSQVIAQVMSNQDFSTVGIYVVLVFAISLISIVSVSGIRRNR